MTDVSPIEYSPKLGVMFAGGADVAYLINDNVGFGTGIGMGGYSALWKFDRSNNEKFETTIVQASLDVLMYFRAVTGKRGNGFFVNTGVIHRFLMSASFEDKYNDVIVVKNDDAKEYFRSYTISPLVYFGANISCGNLLQISIGSQIQYQASDNFSNQVSHGHYLNFALKVGVGLHPYKPKRK